MNDIKTLLVHTDGGQHCADRLRMARALARQLDAQLHALYSVRSAFTETPIEFATGGVIPSTLAHELDESRLASARKVKAQGLAEPGVPFEWHEGHGLWFSTFTQQARYADLLVLGQHDPEDINSGMPTDFVESVVIASGRPALVLPYVETTRTLGTEVLVAWKETPEAARAVSAALPLLQRARRVHVAMWGESEAPETSQPLDIRSYLQAHGVQADVHQHGAAGAEVGDLMQSLAVDLSADLLVMGCYGHARAREFVLGGASRTVLRTMVLPVLTAH